MAMDFAGRTVVATETTGATEASTADGLRCSTMRQMTNICWQIVGRFQLCHMHLGRDTASRAVPVVPPQDFHVAELPLRHGDLLGDPKRGTALLRQRHEDLQFAQVP